MTNGTQPQRYAIASMYAKTPAFFDFMHELAQFRGILSAGGTLTQMEENGIPAEDLEEFTGLGVVLDHRVVTLQTPVHMGLLAELEKPTHLETLVDHRAPIIDIVVGNYYPFGVDPKDFDHGTNIIDQIDVGGPTMGRSGSKGLRAVVLDAKDYPIILDELKEFGEVTLATRWRLAGEFFRTVSTLDANIARYFEENPPPEA